MTVVQAPAGRDRRHQRVVRVGAVLVGVWLVANLASGYVAAHPRLTDLIWDPPHQQGAFADTVGGEVVETDRVRGRFVSPSNQGAGSVVLVHGYNGSIDSEPLVEVARHLRDRGYGVLAINLGYRDVRHCYSGGHREARDISAAIDWLDDRREPVTTVWGFSAGAHAALVAATEDPAVPAVIADSGFADASTQIRRATGDTWRLPDGVFALTPAVVDLFSGDAPIDLLELDWPDTPTLVFGGLDDDTVPPQDAEAIADHTGGRLVTLPVDHTRGALDTPGPYIDGAIEFLDKLEPRLGR